MPAATQLALEVLICAGRQEKEANHEQIRREEAKLFLIISHDYVENPEKHTRKLLELT